MPLPDRQYFSLNSLARRWHVEKDEIQYLVEHGEIAACCWIDLRDVIRYQHHQEQMPETWQCMCFEGYVGLSAGDCRKIFRCGKYKLSSFTDLEQSGFGDQHAP
jgi:hypothetical protein